MVPSNLKKSLLGSIFAKDIFQLIVYIIGILIIKLLQNDKTVSIPLFITHWAYPCRRCGETLTSKACELCDIRES